MQVRLKWSLEILYQDISYAHSYEEYLEQNGEKAWILVIEKGKMIEVGKRILVNSLVTLDPRPVLITKG
jgi:hypothetical protein